MPKLARLRRKDKSIAELRQREAKLKDQSLTEYERAALTPERPLTYKQKQFVKFWAEGNTISMAMQLAGYSENSTQMGYKLARMPHVIELYEAEKARYETAGNMSRKKVMDMLNEAYVMAKLMAEPASMVSAAREIGRMCGYYEPIKRQVEINVTNGVVSRMERMSDNDLLMAIERMQKELADEATGKDDDDDDITDVEIKRDDRA